MSSILDFLNTERALLRRDAENKGQTYGFDFIAGHPKPENFLWKELPENEERSCRQNYAKSIQQDDDKV